MATPLQNRIVFEQARRGLQEVKAHRAFEKLRDMEDALIAFRRVGFETTFDSDVMKDEIETAIRYALKVRSESRQWAKFVLARTACEGDLE